MKGGQQTPWDRFCSHEVCRDDTHGTFHHTCPYIDFHGECLPCDLAILPTSCSTHYFSDRDGHRDN